VLLVFQHSTGY